MPGQGRLRIQRAFILIGQVILIQNAIGFSANDVVERIRIILTGTHRIEIAGSTIIARAIPASRQGSTAALNKGFVVIRRGHRLRVRCGQPRARASRQHDGRGDGGFDFFHEFCVFVFFLGHSTPVKMTPKDSNTGSDARQRNITWLPGHVPNRTRNLCSVANWETPPRNRTNKRNLLHIYYKVPGANFTGRAR
jgi:hypothetical protein